MSKIWRQISLGLFSLFLIVSSAHANTLLDAQELPKLLQDQNTLVLEVSTEPYNGFHIPGALFTNFATDGWVTHYENLPNMLPQADVFSQTLSKFGLNKDKHIVLASVDHSQANIAATTRIFWSLRVYGYNNLQLLNGGIKAYVNQGYSIANHPTPPTPATVQATRKNTKILATYGQVYAGSDYGTPVIDARDYARAGGDARRHPLALRQGKIFDAVIIPATTQFHAIGGKFKSKADLKALYEDTFGDPPGPIVFYSDTGLRAAISWFAAKEILQEKDVRLYDGSYLQWDHLGHEVYDETDDMGGPIGG